jgi:hypothetical protein
MIHYWQPLFSSGKNTEILGVVFMSYVGTSALFSILFAKYAKSELIQSNTMKVMVILAALFSHIGVSLSQSTWSLVVSFCLLQASVCVGRTIISAAINKIIEAKYRASILSSISLISRFGSMLSLALIGLSFTKLENVQILFQINSVLMIIFTIILTYKIVHNSGDIYAHDYNK